MKNFCLFETETLNIIYNYFNTICCPGKAMILGVYLSDPALLKLASIIIYDN